MKTLVQYINEALGVEVTLRNGNKTVTISEDDFKKLSKGHKVTEPFPNKDIKILDGDTTTNYHVVRKGSKIIVTTASEDDKRWHHSAELEYISDEPIYQFTAENPEGEPMFIPTFEFMNPLPKRGSNPHNNKWGMLPVGSNTGTATHFFVVDKLDKVFKMYEKMGFKIDDGKIDLE